MRSFWYLEHILVECQAKKNFSFFSKKIKNFIIFPQFSFGKASYFCVHAINFGPKIMSKFTFETIFIPWTYLSSVPGKKKVLFVIQKFKNFIIFLQFSFGKASYFCVHAINFGPIIMSNFTFEAIFIPWTYLIRVPGKKKFIFLIQKLKKIHIFFAILLWKSFFLCPHVINFGQIIMHKFNFEVILILRIYLSRMRSKKNWI